MNELQTPNVLVKPNKMYLSLSDRVVERWCYFNDHNAWGWSFFGNGGYERNLEILLKDGGINPFVHYVHDYPAGFFMFSEGIERDH